LSTETPTRSYRVNYLDCEPVPQERIDEVGVFYNHLTRRHVYPPVKRLMAVVTRIHADDTERLMQEVFDQIGTDGLLRVLADTYRGEAPRITEEQRRGKSKAADPAKGAAQEPPLPQPEPDSPVEPVFPTLPSDFPPVLLGYGGDVPPSTTPSTDGDGCERPSTGPATVETVEPIGAHVDGGGQPWDQPFWEREAAEGDLTPTARLTFWELLPPEEQFLPEPADTGVGGRS